MAEQRRDPKPASKPEQKPEPPGPHRSERPAYGRKYRTRLPQAQQYIFVGLAILFLVAWFMFRESCSKRIGETFGTVSGRKARDAGVGTKKPPEPMRAMSDPDDW